MAQYLVTEFSASPPQVLIIGDDSSFAADLGEILRERGFTSDFYSFASLSRASTRDRVRQTHYYKIICCSGLAGTPPAISDLTDILAGRREPILFLTRFDSTVDLDNLHTRAWYQTCRDQYRHLLDLVREFPRASLLIVRDLLLEKTPYHPAFPYICRQASEHFLTDPGIPFYFISQDNFLSSITPLIFAPYTGEKTLFTADPISATTIFRHLDDITAGRYKIIVESYPPVDFSFPFPCSTLTGPADLQLLTASYFSSYLHPTAKKSSSSSQIHAPASGVSALLRPKKSKLNADVPLETITLPPPRPAKKTATTTPSVITLPPDKIKKEKKVEKKKTFSPSGEKLAPISAPAVILPDLSRSRRLSRGALKRALRSTITSDSTTVLDHYLQAESITTPTTVCRYVDLDGFNFYQCAVHPRSQIILPDLSVDDKKNETFSPSGEKLAKKSENSTSAADDGKVHPALKSSRSAEKSVFSPNGEKLAQDQEITTIKSPHQSTLSHVNTLFATSPALPSHDLTIINPRVGINKLLARRAQKLGKNLQKIKHKLFGKNKKVVKLSSDKVPSYIGRASRAARAISSPESGSTSRTGGRPLVDGGKVYPHKKTGQLSSWIYLLPILLIAILAYFFIYQPRERERAVGNALSEYFASCQDLTSCFGSTDLQHLSTFTLVHRSDKPELAAAIARLSSRTARVEEHLSSYFITAWQGQAGDPAAELEIVSQSLAPALEELAIVQRLFSANRTNLLANASGAQLDRFAATLDELDARLSLLSDYLPVLAATTDPDELPITVVFLDGHTARTGGGLILGVANLQFEKGRLEDATYLSSSQLAAASAIQVNTPHQFADVTTTDTDGLRNLTFARSFSDTAALLTQALEAGLDFQPQLVVSIDLDTLADFEAFLAATPANSSLASLAATQTTAFTEVQLVDTLAALQKSVSHLPLSRGSDFLLLVLEELDAARFQFYAGDSTLSTSLAGAGLLTQADSILCPSGFGSGTCFLDTFAQHDDYLAANTHLVQAVEHQVVLAADSTRHIRTITYTNGSPTATAIDYLHFTLPTSSTLETLILDGSPIELDEDDAYILTIAPGATATLTLSFSIDRAVTSSDFTYAYYDQFQSGLPNQKLRVSIRPTVPYSPRVIAPSAVQTGGQINFLTNSGRSFFGAVVF